MRPDRPAAISLTIFSRKKAYEKQYPRVTFGEEYTNLIVGGTIGGRARGDWRIGEILRRGTPNGDEVINLCPDGLVVSLVAGLQGDWKMMRQGGYSKTILNIPILGMLMWMLWSKELTICIICGLVLLWAKQTAESVKAARRERMLKNIL